jgi:hypothetical protein
MPRPPDRSYSKHCLLDGWGKGRADRQGHDQGRKGKEYIRNPHDDRINPSTKVSGDKAKKDTKRDADSQHHGGHHERDAVTEDDTGENVSSNLVGSKPMRPTGRLKDAREIGKCPGMLRIGGDIGGQNRHQNNQKYH